MKQTVLRAVVVLLATASIALAGAGGVHAADPDTIGLTVDPAPVHVDATRELTIVNRGTVPMTFTFATPDGWTVEPAVVHALPAGESTQVRLVGDGGDGTMTVNGTAAAGVTLSGQDRSVVAMDVRIHGGSPLAWLVPAFWLLVALVAAAFLLWRTKPWTLRITRTTERTPR